MKSKLMTIAGSCACICIAVAALPVNAEEINSALSGSSRCDDRDENGNCLEVIVNGVTKPLKKNGKKFNKEGNTVVERDATTLIPPNFEDPETYCWIDDQPGFLFVYDYSSAVTTTPNGDLIYSELDDTKISSLCVSQDLSKLEATIHRKISGGSGQYAGACGWEKVTGAGIFLPPDTSFGPVVGTLVGEIFVGADCP